MLDAKEIDIEIAKWEYLESSYDNYAKLANLYTIRDHMKGDRQLDYDLSYSAAPAREEIVISTSGDSEFLQAINGKEPAAVWSVIDELMDTLRLANPRVYNGVMRKLGVL